MTNRFRSEATRRAPGRAPVGVLGSEGHSTLGDLPERLERDGGVKVRRPRRPEPARRSGSPAGRRSDLDPPPGGRPRRR